jgi:predicted nucleotidyltransferase
MDMTSVIDYTKQNENMMVLYLVGSFDTRYHTPLSDIDFAVISRNEMKFNEQAKVLSDFMEILHTDNVDIIFLPGAGLPMQHKVLSNGRLLYNRDPIFLANFIEQTIKLYCDFQIDLNQFYRDYDIGLREEFGYDRT